MLIVPRPSYLRRLLISRLRPRAIAITPAEVAGILKHYDYSTWKIRRGLGGTSSANVLLDTDQGKKVLKRYVWSIDSIIHEHSILKHLATSAFPTPHVLPNKKGLTITQSGDICYAIYEYGAKFRYSDYFFTPRLRRKLVIQAATLLARLHEVNAGFVPHGRKLNGFRPDGQTLWRDVSWHLDILDQYFDCVEQRNSATENDLYLLRVLPELKSAIADTGQQYEKISSEFKQTVIHGDFAPHNVMFDELASISVLDFGDSCRDFRALDVARGLSAFARAGNFGLNFILAKEFLRAYQAVQPMAESEINAIPDLLRWRYLRNVVWKLFHQLSQPDSPMSLQTMNLIRNRLKAARWMKKRENEVRAVLMSS